MTRATTTAALLVVLWAAAGVVGARAVLEGCGTGWGGDE